MNGIQGLNGSRIIVRPAQNHMDFSSFIRHALTVSMSGTTRSTPMTRWPLLFCLLPTLLLAQEGFTEPASVPGTLPAPAPAQGSTPQDATPQVVASRQILAMDRIQPGATEDKLKALLPDEVRAVVNLYLAGKIRQWYFRQDRPGAILILDVGSMEEAERIIGSLPLTRSGLLAYDLIPIGPYVPLATMIPAEPSSKRKKR